MRINDMGLYRLYRRIPDVKHEFRWKAPARPLTERERRIEVLARFPINEMGIYLMLKDFEKKSRMQKKAEQEEMRRLQAEGLSIMKIADILNCDPKLVQRRLASVWRDDEK